MSTERITAVCGGVGGAKLARGLYDVLAPRQLTVVVNTGDDFHHLGLLICPDLDTVVYTLAGVQDRERGWGRADETWQVLEAVGELKGATWFQLGDRDLALHLCRAAALAEGQSLVEFTMHLSRHFGIEATVLPMSDEPVRTMVRTHEEGELPFQRYFVERRCEPTVKKIRYRGVDSAGRGAGVSRALAGEDVAAVILCPSNPWLSIDPILSLPGIRNLVRRTPAPVVAVSPIIAGEAVKGPAAKIMRELGLEVSAVGVAEHYKDFLDGMVIDEKDATHAEAIEALGMRVLVTPTLMNDEDDQQRLATDTLAFARDCGIAKGTGTAP